MSPTPDLDAEHRQLLERFFEGHRGALARAISMVEDEAPGFEQLLHEVLRRSVGEGGRARAGASVRKRPDTRAPEGTPKSPADPGTRPREATRRIGITGPPGAGKSTLVTALTARDRAVDETVGIVAVDPTSPFSGGALLGDRIRMGDLATDRGVFIRSMATRSGSGGLATTTAEVADLMDAYGFDRIVLETVGVGQTELEIAGAADTVVVVIVPESGDVVQAMKAGLMEIADIFVVNKADRPGADALIRDMRQAVDLRRSGGDSPAESPVDPRADSAAWEIPVLRTSATSGEGIDELHDALEHHREWLKASGEGRLRILERARSRIRAVVEREVRRRVWKREATRDLVRSGAEAVREGEETPYSAARRILEVWEGPSS